MEKSSKIILSEMRSRTVSSCWCEANHKSRRRNIVITLMQRCDLKINYKLIIWPKLFADGIGCSFCVLRRHHRRVALIIKYSLLSKAFIYLFSHTHTYTHERETKKKRILKPKTISDKAFTWLHTQFFRWITVTFRLPGSCSQTGKEK